ncbi:hypothetical protein [Rhizobium sp.]|uniref:hypothetical protein n=1 Tax=Rhizobium sp. TaxID=391 RepID=UPI0028A8047D
MKKSSYMTRAMKAKDRRFARILGGLGYERADMTAAQPVEDLAALRKQYHDLFGKRPFNGWDEATLRAKIEEAGAR